MSSSSPLKAAMKKACFSDASVLLSAAAERSSLSHIGDQEIDVFKIASVAVRSFHTTIVDSNELAEIAFQLTKKFREESLDSNSSASEVNEVKGLDNECIYVNGLKLKIPPMVFDKDILSFSFPRSFDSASSSSPSSPAEDLVISFHGSDALYAWVKRHSHIETLPDGSTTVRLPHNEFVEVPYAAEWNAARVRQESDQNDTEKALLTFSDVKLGAANRWDWTFTSDYCFSYCTAVRATGEVKIPRRVVTSSNITEEITGQVIKGLRTVNTSGINMTLLRDTKQPILFSDEMILYQDDLEDSGDVSATVRVRIMPSCVFILFRFFLRVDGALIRMRETRIFHEFNTKAPSIQIETLWKELSLKEPKDSTTAHSSSSSSAAVTAPNTSSTSTSSEDALRLKLNANLSLQSDHNFLSQHLPVVNQKYQVHPYYAIDL